MPYNKNDPFGVFLSPPRPLVYSFTVRSFLSLLSKYNIMGYLQSVRSAWLHLGSVSDHKLAKKMNETNIQPSLPNKLGI